MVTQMNNATGKKQGDKGLPARLAARVSLQLSDYGILLGLIVLLVIFSLASSSFLTFDNIITIVRQISIIAIIAVGETIVLIGGGIDASIGAVAGLGGILSILLASKGINVALSILLGMSVGGVVGLLNGVIITKIGITDFIVTLAMISIAHGTNFSITKAKSIYMNIPKSFMYLGKGYLGPIPIPIILMILIYGAGIYVMRSSKLGTYIQATGGNKVATRLSGINVDRIKIIMYIISGIFASFGGILLTSRLGSGQPTVGDALLLDVIAGVVLGGTSLSGGKGSLWGTILGCTIMGVLSNGLTLLSAAYYVQEIVKGVVIILAVTYTSYRELRASL